MFKILKDIINTSRKINVSVEDTKESLGKEFIEFDKTNANKFNHHIMLGKTGSGLEYTKKLMISRKAINGDIFVVIDNPYGEIEDLAKKMGVDYKLSTDYGDRRIIFNPNCDIEKDININSRFFKVFNKVLVIGNLGSHAYPIFRWVIWNTNEDSSRYVWVDEHGNDEFIHKQKKHNIDIVYGDMFNFEIISNYDGAFLNGLERPSFLEKARHIKKSVVLRIGIDDIERYSLSKLKCMFDLIIIANPNNDEVGKRKIVRLLDSCEEIEKFKKRNEAILVYKDTIKHTRVIYPNDFPIVADMDNEDSDQ